MAFNQEELDRLKAEQEKLQTQSLAARQAENDAISAARVRASEAQRAAAEIAEQIRIAELQRPLHIEVLRYEKEKVYIQLNKFDSAITDLMKKVPGRWYKRTENENEIPIEQWAALRASIETLGTAEITINALTQAAIDAYYKRPDYSVSIEEIRGKHVFAVQVGRGTAYNVYSLPGAELLPRNMGEDGKRRYSFPLIEGWRLIEALKDFVVEWADDAKENIKKQLELRELLDTIATADRCDVNVSFNGDAELRDFQTVGVKFLELINANGILADQMGLGKTWQALGVAESSKYRTVIFCPARLKANWAREIYALTGHTPYICSGIMPTKHDMLRIAVEKKDRYLIINYEILGRIYERAKEDVQEDGQILKSDIREVAPWIEVLNHAGIDLCIVDEGHKIKNVNTKVSRACRQIKIPHIICLTGTPVINRPGELWAMLNMIDADRFPNYDNFVSRYTNYDKTAKNVTELRETLKPIMIRRTKKDVLPDLPPINRMFKWVELSDPARERYKQALEGIYTEVDRMGEVTNQMNITSILAELTRLKQICANDKIDYTAELALDLYDTAQGNSSNGGKGKVIIFSQFKDPVRAITTALQPEAISITGDIPQEERMKLVDRFQNDPDVHFLVATWQTVGEGLNLTAADYVIFNDLFWAPGHHAQSEERAYGRLNDPHPIDSYYIANEKTIEEWIIELLNLKKQIINEVVEGHQAERGEGSVAMQLISRLKEEMKDMGYKRRRA